MRFLGHDLSDAARAVAARHAGQLARWLAPFALAAPAAAQIQVEFATLHGGSRGVAVDANGDAYVLGFTEPAGTVEEPFVPPPSAPCTPGPVPDVSMLWVAKLDGATGEILWSRAAPSGPVYGIATDPAGTSVYVVGWDFGALGAEFPAVGWQRTASPGRDGFVARLNAADGCPQAITWYGPHSGGNWLPRGIFVDELGTVHVVGSTTAADVAPTQVLEGYVPAGGSLEAFAVGFDETLEERRYFCYLPFGSAGDSAQDVVADASGVYVAGFSGSTDIPRVTAQVGPGGGRDVFALKFQWVPNPDPAPVPTAVDYLTVIGGSDGEAIRGNSGVSDTMLGAWIDVDAGGSATVASWTTSSDLPVTHAYGPGGDDDVFVTRLDPDGANPAWVALIGGGRDDVAAGIARDRATGRVYVCGGTKSGDFPVPQALIETHASAPSKFDAYVVELDDSNGGLVAGTFLGSGGLDDADGGVEVDAQGRVHVVGRRGDGFQPAAADHPPSSLSYELSCYAVKLRFGPAAPTPGISVAPTSGLETSEAGGSDSFTVVLDTEPAASVSIDLEATAPWEALISVGGAAPTSLVTLAFDATDWDVARTVTVVGQDDALLDGDAAFTVVTRAAASADPDYAGLDAPDVTGVNLDDEAPPPIDVESISPEEVDAGASVAVTVSGAGFQPGATLSFENGQGPAPDAGAADVTPGGDALTATVSVGSGGPPGQRVWDVRVTNPDGATDVLVGGFRVNK